MFDHLLVLSKDLHPVHTLHKGGLILLFNKPNNQYHPHLVDPFNSPPDPLQVNMPLLGYRLHKHNSMLHLADLECHPLGQVYQTHMLEQTSLVGRDLTRGQFSL